MTPSRAWWRRLLPKHLKEQKGRLWTPPPPPSARLRAWESPHTPTAGRRQAEKRHRHKHKYSEKPREWWPCERRQLEELVGRKTPPDHSHRWLTDQQDVWGGGKQQNTPEGVRWRLHSTCEKTYHVPQQEQPISYKYQFSQNYFFKI